jgi:hypothetical protein
MRPVTDLDANVRLAACPGSCGASDLIEQSDLGRCGYAAKL